jgi:hypothetical protein
MNNLIYFGIVCLTIYQIIKSFYNCDVKEHFRFNRFLKRENDIIEINGTICGPGLNHILLNKQRWPKECSKNPPNPGPSETCEKVVCPPNQTSTAICYNCE